MNRKNILCALLILATVLCFASVAGADSNPYQSRCNPYANMNDAYGGYGYGYGAICASDTAGQRIIDRPAANESDGDNRFGGNGASRSGQSACYQPAANPYYAKGNACATTNPSADCEAAGDSFRWGRDTAYCPPQPVPSAPDENTPNQQDDGYYTPGTLTSQERILVDMINDDRKSRGLDALPVDLTLVSLARQKSLDMIQNGYFAHESPTYGSASEMLSDAGYSFKGVGENIAKSASAEKAHAALMSSQGHRKNILGSQWTKMGVGIVNDFNGYPYVTELFVR